MKRSNISFSGLGRAIALVGALACGCVGVEGGRFAETSLPVRAALGPFVERGEIAGHDIEIRDGLCMSFVY